MSDDWLVLEPDPSFRKDKVSTIERLVQHACRAHTQGDKGNEFKCPACKGEYKQQLGRGRIINKPTLLLLQFSRLRAAGSKLLGDLAAPQLLRLSVDDGKGGLEQITYAAAATAEHIGQDRMGHWIGVASPGRLLASGARGWVPIDDDRAQTPFRDPFPDEFAAAIRRRIAGESL